MVAIGGTFFRSASPAQISIIELHVIVLMFPNNDEIMWKLALELVGLQQRFPRRDLGPNSKYAMVVSSRSG